jgi:hypothetical protein
MKNFKVAEIINANTIRVSPKWHFLDASGRPISDDKIRILGFNVSPDDKYAQNRLTSLLMNREVDLVDPTIISENVGRNAFIGCYVLLDGTDITYYFPEYHSKSKKEVVYY